MYMYLVDILQLALDNARNGRELLIKFYSYELKIRRCGPKL